MSILAFPDDYPMWKAFGGSPDNVLTEASI
jgi:hypothetical protein